MARWKQAIDIHESWQRAQDGELELWKLADEIHRKLRPLGHRDIALETLQRLFGEYAQQRAGCKKTFDALMDELHDWGDDGLRLWIAIS